VAEEVPSGTESDTSPAVSVEAAQFRSLRRLVIVALVLSVSALLASCAAAAVAVVMIGGPVVSLMPGGMPDQSADIEKAVRTAFGDDLVSVSVTAVNTDIGEELPLPYSMMGGGPETYAVRYRVKGAPMDITGQAYSAEELAYSGLLPLQGSLDNTLTKDQLVGILTAYAKEGHDVAGPVSRYRDPRMALESPELSSESTITIDGESYSAERMWRVGTAVVPVDGKVSGDPMSMDAIFYVDPKSGEVRFLGTETGTQMGF